MSSDSEKTPPSIAEQLAAHLEGRQLSWESAPTVAPAPAAADEPADQHELPDTA